MASKPAQEKNASPQEQSKKSPAKEAPAFDPWKVLLYPHLAEKSMTMVELQNKLTFMVEPRASKRQIVEAVEQGFQVSVKKVNVELTRKGQKKAYVTLAATSSAADVATRLGMI